MSDSPALPPTLTPGHPLLGLGYTETHRLRPFVRLDGDSASQGSAAVAEEVPVAFVYNQRPHVVMMATPADLEDFAVGFTLTEEIVPDAGAIADCQVVRYSQGIELQIRIPSDGGNGARESRAAAGGADRVRTVRCADDG